MIGIYRYIPLMLFVALLVGCFAASVSAQINYYGPPARGPIPAKVLLLIPENFERFELPSAVRGRETIHPFGREATDELRRMLTPAFGSAAVWSTLSETAAMDLLSPDNPRNAEVRMYDYVAIPRFVDANMRPGPQRYRFEINLIVDFYGTDGSNITSIRGYGESTTGYWHPSSVLSAGHLAMRSAVEAIRDGVDGKWSFFAAVPRPRYTRSSASPPPLSEAEPAPSVTPIPVRVLLLVPDEFSRFVYTSSAGGVKTDHFLGEKAEGQFWRILGPQFQFMELRPVVSETAARDMLSPDNPEHSVVKGYDYVGIPRFSDVNAWSDRLQDEMAISMVVEFYSADGSKDIKFTGRADRSTGRFSEIAPPSVEAENLALTSAIEAIRQNIDRQRDLFFS